MKEDGLGAGSLQWRILAFRNPFPLCFKRLQVHGPIKHPLCLWSSTMRRSQLGYSISVTLKAVQMLWQDLIVLTKCQRNSRYLTIQKNYSLLI